MNSTNDQIKNSTATDGKPPVMRSVCQKCERKGCYCVDEWVGPLQGRKDCKCKGKHYSL